MMPGRSSTLDRITVKFIRTRRSQVVALLDQALEVAHGLGERPVDPADPVVHLGARSVDRDVEAAHARVEHRLASPVVEEDRVGVEVQVADASS